MTAPLTTGGPCWPSPILPAADGRSGRGKRPACSRARGIESSSINVELLADIQKAFGDKEAMASADLVAALVADPEWPWAEWTRGRPLTQRQLARLLKPFFIIPQTVHIHGFKDAKGYSRIAFEQAWAAYLPGQDASSRQFRPCDPSKRPNPDGMGTSCNFRSVQAAAPDGSKNAHLSNSHAGLDAWTDKTADLSPQRHFDQAKGDPIDRPDEVANGEDSSLVCQHCGAPATDDAPVQVCTVNGEKHLLRPDCRIDWLGGCGAAPRCRSSCGGRWSQSQPRIPTASFGQARS